MWPFKSKSDGVRPLLRGLADWHSHILPGVDDGVKTMDEALEVLDLYVDAGVAEVWLTPHIMEDIPNTTEGLRARFAELQEAYDGPLKLHLGSENMLDNLFAERLEKDDLLPVGEDGDLLLVETSYFNPPMGLYETLHDIRRRGYTPLLAHPERYLYMGHSDYLRLKNEGVLLQVSIPSLAGLYGKEVRKKAEWLRKKGLADRLGTDVHNRHMARKILE